MRANYSVGLCGGIGHQERSIRAVERNNYGGKPIWRARRDAPAGEAGSACLATGAGPAAGVSNPNSLGRRGQTVGVGSAGGLFRHRARRQHLLEPAAWVLRKRLVVLQLVYAI